MYEQLHTHAYVCACVCVCIHVRVCVCACVRVIELMLMAHICNQDCENHATMSAHKNLYIFQLCVANNSGKEVIVRASFEEIRYPKL